MRAQGMDWLPYAILGIAGLSMNVAIIGFGYEPSLQSVAIAAYTGLMVVGLPAAARAIKTEQ